MNAPASPFAASTAPLPGIAAAAARHGREGGSPHGSLAALRGAGLLALAVPASVGEAAAGLRVSERVVEAVGAACPATAPALAMQCLKHAAPARDPAWPDASRERVQRDAVAEGALINAPRVEPESGSPTRGGLPATVARRAAEGRTLPGRERHSTGTPALRWLELWACADEDAPRVGAFLVPADAPGIGVAETWDHLGLRASGSHDVAFHAAPVQAGYAIGLAPPGAPPRESIEVRTLVPWAPVRPGEA